jgi:hypothetical protein
MMNKKGQVNNLQGIIITLVVVGIILSIGFIILDEFKDTAPTYTGTVTDEDDAYLNATGYTLDKASECNFGSPVITEIVNITSGLTIGTGNASVTDAGVVTNASTVTLDDANFSYTYVYGGEACEGVADTIDATANIPDWLSIIVILAIVGIILAIVFNVLPKNRSDTAEI